jgi:glyoxylase-like metal-dependent hydrolase (beta-lactamase superfamily II)
MDHPKIRTIDLKFLGMEHAIAVYLIPHRRGAVLVESGPGSTKPALLAGIQGHGYSIADITDLFLTHIHLDHAGASGWLARQGVRVHVHPVGAPHLIDPRKLLSSAGRIYGDAMESLWGEFLSAPPDRLNVLKENDEVNVEGLVFRPLDTPGHASHHYAYLFEDVCFSGDIGGIRMPGVRHLRLPMPPPEFDPESWRKSLAKLKKETFEYIIPTHFGVYTDPAWHLTALEKALDEVEAWMEAVMPRDLSSEELNDEFLSWTRERSLGEGVSEEILDVYEAANPSWMSSQGIQRYWQKFRLPVSRS